MAVKYDDVIVFSFVDDFEGTDSLRKKYLNKGVKFYHVVLTADLDSKKLSNLREKYPFLVNETVDIKSIQEGAPGIPPQLKCVIHEKTKVIIRGHGRANSDSIGSEDSERVKMRELAKLLQKNCSGNTTIKISLYSCFSGTGKAVNTVEGSIARALHDSLKEQGMNPTISAPRSLSAVFSEDGKRRVALIIEDDSLSIVSNQGSVIQEQIDALSIFPWAPVRKDLQVLYDMDKSLQNRRFHKGLDSKVILKSDGTDYYPYAESEIAHLSDEDETIKRIYDYYRVQRIHREEARRICLQYLADIAVENPEIQNYKGFQRLKHIICFHPYPYPALLSYIADGQTEKTELMQFSAEKGTWEESKDPSDNRPGLQESRRALLSAALDNFKDRINRDLDLKEIQRKHTELARNTKYRVNDKETDKNKALGGIGASVGLVGVGLIVASITFTMFPPIGIILLCMVIGSAAAVALGYGLANSYRYLQAKQNSKQRVTNRPDTVVSASSSDVSSSKRYSDSKLSGKEEPLLPRTPNQSKVFEGLIQCGLFGKETTQEGINTPRPALTLGL